MYTNELETRKSVSRWLEYAKNDLQAAKVILSQADIAPRTACFLAQQSVEKALKALSILKGIDIVKTHDLDALVEKLPYGDSSLFEALDLIWLTGWSESRDESPGSLGLKAHFFGKCPNILTYDRNSQVFVKIILSEYEITQYM